jgi:MFS transporter, AAHS family, 4-hydroxybenzoate transporter
VITEEQQQGSGAAGVTLAGLVDGKAFGAFQLQVVALCVLAQIVDGFDNQASAFAAPALAAHWQVARAVLGPVFSAGAFGTLFGALMIGPVGDLLGRKTLIVLSLILAAGLMAVTGSVTSIGELTVIRFLTGLPLGALIPGTVVVANEWSPARSRTAVVTIIGCGFALGAILGGLLSSVLLPRFGWPSIFHAGAAGTTVIAIAVLVWMPESLRFLSQRPGEARRARIAKILRRFDPALDPASIQSGEGQGAALPASARANLVAGLFTQGRAPMTLLLWITYFMNMLVLNFTAFWLPTLLTGAGLTAAAAIRTSTLFQFGGIAGVVLMGLLANRLGALRIIAAGFLLSAGAVTLVGALSGGGRNGAIMAAGFLIIGIQAVLATFSASFYPTAMRSTGTSWAQGVSRVGATVGPLIGGIMIGWHWSLPRLFVSIALIELCGFGLALLLTRQSRIAKPMAVAALA